MTPGCQRGTSSRPALPRSFPCVSTRLEPGEPTMQPSKRIVSAQINDQSITVKQGETLLQAALRHGMEFSNSCRAGGCGTCKCRLTSGAVKELTETGYLLTAEE